MNFLFSNRQLMVAIFGAMMTIKIELPAVATTFNPGPLFDSTASYSTTILRSDGGGDTADIYYPVLSDTDSHASSLPVALFLQGALVDKSNYSNSASIVASYGFVVVVPNHLRTATSPAGPVKVFLPEQQQVNDVLTYMVAEDSNPSSPVSDLDSSTLVLLGHSFGGAVGLAAIQGNCFPVLCTEQFERPHELKGGAFYGTNFLDGQGSGSIPSIDNDAIPIALVQGSRDSVATPAEAEATYAQIEDPSKVLITISGANHYGITNDDNPLRESVRPTIEQDIATETAARWSALFLRGTVLNDKGAFDYVFSTGDALDKNVSIVSVAKPVPELTSIVGLLVLGTTAAGLLLQRKRKN